MTLTQPLQMNEFLTAIPFSLLLVVTTGPIFFVIIETSISKGARQAFCVDIGAVLADILFILIALYGANTLHQSLQDNPRWFLLGGGVLVTFGLFSFFRTQKAKNSIDFETQQIRKGSYLFYIGKGFLLNIINMGAFLYWLGIMVVFGAKYQMDSTKLITFFVSLFGVYLAIDLVKINLAKQLKSKLTPKIIYKLKQFVNFILILFGLFFVFNGAFPKQKQKLENHIEERLK